MEFNQDLLSLADLLKQYSPGIPVGGNKKELQPPNTIPSNPAPPNIDVLKSPKQYNLSNDDIDFVGNLSPTRFQSLFDNKYFDQFLGD